jgi:hypothetical protein
VKATTRFRVEFEAFSAQEAGSFRAQGYLPFALRATNLEKPVTIRWAITQVEEHLLSGKIPLSAMTETIKLPVGDTELAVID